MTCWAQARRRELPGMVRTGATVADAVAEWLRYVEHDRAVKPSTLTDYRHTADGSGAARGDVSRGRHDRAPRALAGHADNVEPNGPEISGDPPRHLSGRMKVWGLPTNPAAMVERPRYRVSDDLDAFSPDEVGALVRAAGSEQDAAMCLTAAFTRLRMGGLLALQLRDIDYAGETIRVCRSYNVHGGVGSPNSGKVRSVPMVPDVARHLASLPAVSCQSSPRISCSPTSSAPSRTPPRPGFATALLSRARAWMGHSDMGPSP